MNYPFSTTYWAVVVLDACQIEMSLCQIRNGKSEGLSE